MEIKVNGELLNRIKLNRKRMGDEIYSYPGCFSQSGGWPGDFEGRCILSLVSLFKAFNGYKEEQESILNQLKLIISHLKEYINLDGYFGEIISNDFLDEQQLSGNSWYLRGLIEYYDIAKDEEILSLIKIITKNFIYKIGRFFTHYPINKRDDNGGVGGNTTALIVDGWKESTDVGCAFILVDGISKLYELTLDIKVKEILEVLIEKFMNIDVIGLKCQTHATLSCTRGILTLYRISKETKYLNYAVTIFNKYLSHGMTKDYSNINWFDRSDTWTEPCCIVDSFIVSKELYEFTKEEKYLILTSRIYLNAFKTLQRGNGGAGCNSCLFDNINTTKVYLYEAYFCCTMRLGEGLKVIKDFLVSEDKENDQVQLNILTPNHSETSYGNIEVKGDIYRQNNSINIQVSHVKKPFILKVYISKEAGFTMDFEKKSYKNSILEIEISHDINIDIKFKLEPHKEGEINFVGDCLLVKRDSFKDPISYKIKNNDYYYMMEYINIDCESEALSLIQEL